MAAAVGTDMLVSVGSAVTVSVGAGVAVGGIGVLEAVAVGTVVLVSVGSVVFVGSGDGVTVAVDTASSVGLASGATPPGGASAMATSVVAVLPALGPLAPTSVGAGNAVERPAGAGVSALVAVACAVAVGAGVLVGVRVAVAVGAAVGVGGDTFVTTSPPAANNSPLRGSRVSTCNSSAVTGGTTIN